MRTFTLGHYPHIGLSEARRLSRQMAHNVRHGGADPVAAARAKRASTKETPGHTLTAVLDLYGRGQRAASWASQMRPQIERIFRAHLETPIASLTVGELQFTADNHPKPKSASFGVRCLLTVLRWAAVSGRSYVDRSMLDLQAPAAKPRRERVLGPDELGKLLPVLRANAGPYAAAMRLILLTAARRGEVEAARWQDIDLTTRTWTLPDTKNGTRHAIPLSSQAIALLRSIAPVDQADPQAWVFTSTRGKPLSAWENATLAFRPHQVSSAGTGMICAAAPQR